MHSLDMYKPWRHFIYGNILYDNCTLSSGQSLELLQRRAALICTGAYRHTESQALLQELGWAPLHKRRFAHKMVHFFKIINHIYPNYLYNLLTPTANTTYNLRNVHLFTPRHCNLQSSINSFFPSATREWNLLPPEISNLTSIQLLKFKILQPIKPNPFYKTCTGRQGIWLTRLRLGLSPLNYHRYSYNFIADSKCPSCGHHKEDTVHYFLNCPTYNLARQTLLGRLLDELNLDTQNTITLVDIILHGKVDKSDHKLLLNIVADYMATTKV